MISLPPAPILAALWLAVSAGLAGATDRYKANNQDNLQLGSSWTNGAPGSGDVAVWDATVATAGNATNNLSAASIWGGIRILNPVAPIKLGSSNNSTLSLGGSGLDLNQSSTAQDLWLALPVTTVQPQTWSLKSGRTLIAGETNAGVNFSASTTVNGHVKFPSSLSVIDGGTLAIPDGTTVEPTLSFAGAVVQIGNNSGGGVLSQTGGSLILNRTDGSSGSPKSALVLGSANNATAVYNLTGGSLSDTTPNSASTVIIGNGSGVNATWNIAGTGQVQVVGLRMANAANVTATLNLSNNCSLTLTSTGANNNFDVGRITTSGTTYNSASLNLFGGTLNCLPTLNVPHGNGPGFFNLYGGNAFIGGNLNLQDSGAGNGTVTVSGGSLTVSNSINLPAGGSGTGTFNLNGGGVVVSSFTRSGTNSGTLLLNGGVLKPRTATASFIANNIIVNVGSNGACLDTSGFSVTIPAALLHSGGAYPDGGLLKLGSGTLTLTASNSYTGPTVVSGGTLLVNNTVGSGTGSGDVLIQANAALGGSGTIAGSVTVEPGGTLLPGLTIKGTVTQVPQPAPSFTELVVQDRTNLVFSGSNGIPNAPLYLRTSTNAMLPLGQWTLLAAGQSGSDGTFCFTNALNPAFNAQFYALALTQPPLDTEVLAMLANIRDNGFNSDPDTDNGLGGLWINWRFGTTPLQVNFNGSGLPDDPAVVNPPRHDPLTDLRYLHNLLWYRQRQGIDTQFDADIARYTGIVKYEFNNSQNERGWICDEEFLPMFWLSGDDFFRQQTLGQAAYFANSLYRSNIGAYYKTSSTHTNGYYRVDWEVEIGCALVQAGNLFTNADWVSKGYQMVQYAYDHAYLTNYHLFLQQMDDVFLPDGSVNPNQSFFEDSSTDGGSLRFGSIGQEAISLLHVYLVTSNQLFLSRALDLLDPLTVESNLFGLWDTPNGGYFEGLDFPGPTFQSPGVPSLASGKKEAGRQITMLQAYHLANFVTTNRYATTEAALLNVALQKAYYAPGHGVLYEMRPDWSLVSVGGVSEDWVTTEAMGIVLEALFSLGEPRPW